MTFQFPFEIIYFVTFWTIEWIPFGFRFSFPRFAYGIFDIVFQFKIFICGKI